MDARSGPFPDDFFRRQDESLDPIFYADPRLVVHIDEPAVEAVKAYLADVLPPGGVVLDLMSSWRSHLPDAYESGRVIGLGLNRIEMQENPRLNERVVHDLNADPVLPFDGGRFDAVLVTVSIQYLTKPVDVFREVRRVLKVGGSCHVIFSDRMFPTKAVAIWQSLPQPEKRAGLIAAYFDEAEGWSEPEFLDRSPAHDGSGDPVYVVSAARLA